MKGTYLASHLPFTSISESVRTSESRGKDAAALFGSSPSAVLHQDDPGAGLKKRWVSWCVFCWGVEPGENGQKGKCLHSSKLTWQAGKWTRIEDVFPMYFLLNMGIFRCYVS